MLILIFPFIVICDEFYTSLDGADNDFCHILSPCSFDRVMNKIRSKDVIIIKGEYIEDPDDLEKVRVLFNTALSLGCTVASSNMTINGTRLKNIGFSYIVVQSAEDSRIHFFHFTGFSCSIACFRTVEKGVISNSYFTNNHVVGGIGLLSFGVGKCKLDECVLTENTVLNSSLITMFSTHLYLNMTLIERNFVKSNSRQALLFAINSVCEYTNTTIRMNSSPYAPLHQFEFRSCFGFWNCTFEFNNNPEIMLCDGTCEFNFTNSTIRNNMGSFLTTSINPVVSFNESYISNNFSGNKSLFYIPGGEFYIFHPCVFRENHGKAVINTKGVKSLIDITHGIFIKNKVSEFVIGSDESSNVKALDCKFIENFANNGVLNLKKTYADIINNSYIKNRNLVFRLNKGKTRISNSNFIHNVGRENDVSSIIAEKTSLSMNNCYFQGSSLNGHIRSNKKKTGLFKLQFSGNKQYSLSSELQSSCFLCSYNFRKSHNSFSRSLKIFIIFLIFVMLFILIFDFIRKERMCFRKKYHIRSDDIIFV